MGTKEILDKGVEPLPVVKKTISVEKLARMLEISEAEVFELAFMSYYNVEEIMPDMRQKIRFDFQNYHFHYVVPYYVSYFADRKGSLRA